MLFSSLVFLFTFLPITLLVYYLVPRKVKNVVLLIASLIFYAWGEPVYVLIMLFSIVFDYANGRLIEHFKNKNCPGKAKAALIVDLCGNLAILGFFKYTDFVIGSINSITGAGLSLLHIALPIGISFFTFQTMSYTIDVYKGSTEVQKNWIKYGTYVSMFPQLIAGPIVQYKTIAEQMDHRKEKTSDFSEGIHRFMIGLGKKVLIANNIGALWDAIAVLPVDGLAAGTAWLGALAYTFQIYFDFSGYSDMAIGLGKMFGFHFLENFNYPYISKSITEFWRRWHISLSSWFKEYVYIPLGGNRCKIAKQIRNILVVWMLTGIWHGANWNYVLWGCYYGALLLIEKLVLKKVLNRLPGIIQRIYTMFFVVIGWIIFKCEDMAYGISYLKAMFGGFGQGLWNNETLYLLGNYAVLFVLAILGSTMLPKKAAGVVLGGRKRTWAENVIYIAFYAVIFFVSVAYLVDATYNPFLYFRF